MNYDITVLITYQEAADILSVSRPRIYQLVAAGKLTPIEISNRKFLDDSEVKEFAELPRKVGRPESVKSGE